MPGECYPHTLGKSAEVTLPACGRLRTEEPLLTGDLLKFKFRIVFNSIGFGEGVSEPGRQPACTALIRLDLAVGYR